MEHIMYNILKKGQVKDGKKNGKGVLKWPDGHIYEVFIFYYKGDFKDDKLNGKGVFKYLNKDVFIVFFII